MGFQEFKGKGDMKHKGSIMSDLITRERSFELNHKESNNDFAHCFHVYHHHIECQSSVSVISYLNSQLLIDPSHVRIWSYIPPVSDEAESLRDNQEPIMGNILVMKIQKINDHG